MSRTRNNTLVLLIATLFVLIATSCVTSRTGNCQPDAPKTTASLLQPIDDPLEPINRVVQDINYGLEVGVVHPIAQIYRFVTPEFLRKGIAHFGENLYFPLYAVNHLLQGEPGFAWHDTKRFVINTTAGGLGFWDNAAKWGMPAMDTDFQDTFAKWGMGEGCYVNLPLLGPGSLRDTAGQLANLPFLLHRYFVSEGCNIALTGTLLTNKTAIEEPRLYSTFLTQPNDYELFKAFSCIAMNREIRFKDVEMLENPEPDDTYGALALKPKDDAFIYQSRQRKVKLADGSVVPYTCYPTRGGAKKLVVILPGIGTHRQSQEIAAFAELFRSQDCDTLIVSSTFLPDYFEKLATDTPPGFLPEDVKTLSQVLQAAISDYRKHYDVPAEQPCVLFGYSLGALNTLHLLAYQKQGGAPELSFERVLTLNPPRNPLAALRSTDELFDIPESWPAETRDEHLDSLVNRLGRWLMPMPGEEASPIPPLTHEESMFLLGIYMRLDLVNTTLALEKRTPTGIFQNDPQAYFHRNALFAEAIGFSFQDYLEKLLLPWYQKHGYDLNSVEDMAKLGQLDAIADELSGIDNLFVFQNKNDFLIKAEDADWYTQTFGNRCMLFDRGGHLGAMAREDYQHAIVNTLLQ